MTVEQIDQLTDLEDHGIIRSTSSVPLPTRVGAVNGRGVAEELGMLTSNEVCEQSGITYRMLDYWTMRGLITPAVHAKGSGTARLFHPDIIHEIQDLVARIEACPYHPHSGARRQRSPVVRLPLHG